MQKCANLVELEKCCQTHIFLQNFVLMQPRTSPPKICKILPILVTLTPNPYVTQEVYGGTLGWELGLSAYLWVLVALQAVGLPFWLALDEAPVPPSQHFSFYTSPLFLLNNTLGEIQFKNQRFWW